MVGTGAGRETNDGRNMSMGVKKKKVNFGTLGVAIGIVVVIISIVWVTIASLCRDDRGGNEVTWVG